MADEGIGLNGSTGGVLEPVSIEDFFTHYWEQQPLHVARSNQHAFADLISVGVIERLLSTNELHYPTVQLSHSGQSIPVSEYTDGSNKIVSSRIIDRYRSGSTIVLSHAHKLHDKLMNLCRQMQSSFMMRCQTNVYLSPAGNQGFNPHFDTHDVFILQVSGKKTFNFYAGGASFPTDADRFNGDIHTVGAKTEEIKLHAGDTLYIPRGVVHDAVADTDEPSLHVTLGVYPILMHELLQEIARIGVASNPELRRAIPQDLWLSSDGAGPCVSTLKQLVESQINDEVLHLALSGLRDEIALDSVQDVRNVLSKSTAGLGQAQAHSEIRVHRDHVLHSERMGNTLKLRTFGSVIEFEDPLGTCIEWLLKRPQVAISDIPGLDPSQRQALLDRLSACGVISLH